MKNYFIKEIPLGGEIKKGDKVRDHLNQVGIVDSINDGLVWGFSHKVKVIEKSPFSEVGEIMDCKKEELKKIGKLFLYNRDIKIGDKVKFCQTKDNYKNNDFNIDGSIVQVYENEVEVLYSLGINATSRVPVPRNYILKVIGEISSDALNYVKEGDEFDESQIGYLFRGNTNPTPLSELSIKDKELAIQRLISKFDKRVAIKGPCGHFH